MLPHSANKSVLLPHSANKSVLLPHNVIKVSCYSTVLIKVSCYSTVLIKVSCYRTVSARASSFLPLLLVHQDATCQTNLILPHHANSETCPVQRRKFFRCVTGNLLSCNVYTLLISSIRLKYIVLLVRNIGRFKLTFSFHLELRID